MLALTLEAAGRDGVDADRVVIERLIGCDALGAVPVHPTRSNAAGTKDTKRRPELP
jgi:hypothetical protein